MSDQAGSVDLDARTIVQQADNLALYRLTDKHVKLWKKLQPLLELLEKGDYQERFNKYATAIMTIVQYMCGVDDEIRKITIEASDDQGKPYKIIIL
jgi:hypothetical protein